MGREKTIVLDQTIMDRSVLRVQCVCLDQNEPVAKIFKLVKEEYVNKLQRTSLINFGMKLSFKKKP